MASYKRMTEDVIKKADVLLEVVDARFPDETRNREVERDIARAKTILNEKNKSEMETASSS